MEGHPEIRLTGLSYNPHAEMRKDLGSIFDKYDSNQSGSLTCEELDKMLLDIRKHLPLNKLYFKRKEEFLRSFKEEGDDKISRQKFVDRFMEYFDPFGSDIDRGISIILGKLPSEGSS